METLDFLVEAKKNTYASGRKAMPLPNGFEGFIYEKEGLLYVDEYIGSEVFSGKEYVKTKKHGNILFEMEYQGQSHASRLAEELSEEQITDFLKECLMEVPRQAPFRGPKHKKKYDSEEAKINLEYYNHMPRHISREGRERIMLTQKNPSGLVSSDVFNSVYKVNRVDQDIALEITLEI